MVIGSMQVFIFQPRKKGAAIPCTESWKMKEIPSLEKIPAQKKFEVWTENGKSRGNSFFLARFRFQAWNR